MFSGSISMSKSVFIILSVVIFSLLPAFGEALNKTCPVKGKKIAEDKQTQLTISFCCGKCKSKFDKDPSAFLGKVAAAEDGKCPVSGEEVDEDET